MNKLNKFVTDLEYLHSLRTKQLLQIKVDNAGVLQTGGCVNLNDFCCVDLQEINEVLTTRSHIPNKNTRKFIRQQAAKKLNRVYNTPY